MLDSSPVAQSRSKNDRQSPAQRRAEKKRRRRTLVILAAFALAYTVARWSSVGPQASGERPAWWLPKSR